MKIEEKGNSLYFYGIFEKPIKIPSQMYPLTGQYRFMYHDNTEPFDETEETGRIRETFDSVKAGIGTCYSNTETLIEALEEKGIKAEPHVGWLIIGDEPPIHHCFTVIDNHILDFAPHVTQFYKSEFIGATKEESRELLTDYMVSLKDMPNSKKGTFGQLDTGTIIVAAPCKPNDGRKVYQKLIKAFPKHPCTRGLNNGRSKTQQILYDKMQ